MDRDLQEQMLHELRNLRRETARLRRVQTVMLCLMVAVVVACADYARFGERLLWAVLWVSLGALMIGLVCVAAGKYFYQGARSAVQSRDRR